MDLRRTPELRARPALRLDPPPVQEWSWPPGGPWPPVEGTDWVTEEWAPATTVRRPLVRVGRWTLVYRRRGC